jgi:hypothetical protein
VVATEGATAVPSALFNHRRVGDRVVVSNLAGSWDLLSPEELAAVMAGGVPAGSGLHQRLTAKGLVRDGLDRDALAQRLLARWVHLRSGPWRHVVCVTGPAGEVMPLALGTRCLDLAFLATARSLEIHVRGGGTDPLAEAWPTTQGLFGYAGEKNQLARKPLTLTLRTELPSVDPTRIEALAARGVELQVVIRDAGDDEALGSRLRAWTGAWEAVVPCTRATIADPDRLAERLRALGAGAFRLEPALRLDALGGAPPELTYPPQAYLAFLGALLDRLASDQTAGAPLLERTTQELCRKVLGPAQPEHPRVRSPAPDGLGELGYDHEGRIYASDLGRELGTRGDRLFELGNVRNSGYHDVVGHPTVRALAMASTLEGQPDCEACAYLPFCGLLPAFSYGQQGSLQGRARDHWLGTVQRGLLDWIFDRLARDPADPALHAWAAP